MAHGDRSWRDGLVAYYGKRRIFSTYALTKGMRVVLSGLDARGMVVVPATNEVAFTLIAAYDAPASSVSTGVPWMLIDNVSTGSASVGDPVYAGSLGGWTLTAALGLHQVGQVVVAHASTGVVYLDPGYFMGVPVVA